MVLYELEEDDIIDEERSFSREELLNNDQQYTTTTTGLNISVREPTPEDSNAMIMLGSTQHTTLLKKDIDDQKGGGVIEVLDDELRDKLLKRLPQIVKSNDNEDFFMREKSLKPPRSANINEIPFPPEENLEKPEQVRKEEEELMGSKLSVLRYLPEGPVDRSVPHISITFSQPMVEVSGVEDVHDQDFSFIKIDPLPKNGGRFRWMGAKTLFYEPNYRFDMSTEYTVTLDCEKTKSSVGGVLEKNISFKFETPRLTLLNYLPNSYAPVPINEFPYVYLEFDQDIDPNQIISSVTINGNSPKLVLNDGRTSVVKNFIEEKLKESSLLKRASSLYYSVIHKLENSPPNRHVWIDVSTRRVELSESITVRLLEGARSVEGPLKTKDEKSFSITNYPQFNINFHSGGKLPLEAFSFTFSNNIDIELLEEEHIKIEPPIGRLRIQPSGNYITISGNIKGRTTYQVEFSDQVTDVWGQQLSGEKKYSFSVGPAAQSLQAYKTGMIVVDPTVNTKPSFSVFSVNLEAVHVQVYQVKPSDYSNNLFYYDAYNHSSLSLTGKPVLDTIFNTNGQPDEPVDTEIDLTPFLQYPNEMLGQLLVAVEPSKTHWKGEWKYRPVLISWIQVTKMAMDGFFDSTSGNLYCWANSLIDGSVLKNGVSFKQKKFLPSFATKPDPETGIAVLSYTSNGEYILIGHHLNDTCLIDVYLYHYNLSDFFAYRIFNDRGLYKPGEEIFIKGICRDIKIGKYGSKRIPSLPKKGTYDYVVKDSRGAKYHTGKFTISENGSFDIKFSIPDNVNLGTHSIEFNNRAMHTQFDVQEFRTPEFTVSTSVPPCRYLVNGLTILKTQAAYYSGGGLSGSKCSYTIKQSKTSYAPPTFSDFNFTTTVSNPFYCYWWRNESFSIDNYKPVTFEGVCNSDGEHEIAILFNETERQEKSPMNITVETSVQDINRQTINDSTSFLVHPCKYYCGMKVDKLFVKPNVQTNLWLVTTDIEGNAVPGIDMELTATTTVEKKKGLSVVKESVEVFKQVLKSGSEPIKYPVSFDKGGNYKFHLSIKDTETGFTNASNTSLYVTGGKSKRDVGSRLSKQEALLVADKSQEYEVGEEAKILIQSPFDGKAHGVVSVFINSVTENIPITIDPEIGSTEFSLTITKDYIPNVTVSVVLQGSETRTDSLGLPLDLPKQPAYASGTTSLSVSTRMHQLDVQVTPEKQFVTPGVETYVDVMIKDKVDSIPQSGCEVCLVGVDEAVLSLTGYRIHDPLSTFITSSGKNCTEFSLRDNVFVKSFDNINIEEAQSDSESDEEECCYDDGDCCCECMQECCCCACECDEEYEEKPVCRDRKEKTKKKCKKEKKGEKEEENDEGGSDAKQEAGIVVRKNFNPVAVFSPVCITDAQGKTRVPIKLPDNLTRYRITAVAIKQEHLYGLGGSSIVAQLPLAIRPSLPRFLNFGDKAEFSCVLQNQTLVDLNVQIAVAHDDGLELLDTSKRGLNVKIPALKRAELRFPMQATKVGISKFQVAVSVSSFINFSDAVEKEIRVFTPATSEAFAHYGELDGDCTSFQPVKAPNNIYPQFGGLQITTSSTALSSLTDAFLYIYNYGFNCCEQLSSKILSIIALKDVLQAFKVKDIPNSLALNGTVQLSISILNGRQFPNGGYSWWTYSPDASVSPYISCHVGHAFARAKIAGYSLNPSVVSKLTEYLCNIENYIYNYYHSSTKYGIRSYAYYVAALLGDSRSKQKAVKLYSECGLKDTSLETLAWIASAIFFNNGKVMTTQSTEILNYILMRVNETAQTANFVTSYGDEQNAKLIMLHSDRRTDGICLEALIHMATENNLIPKVVKGLLAHKKKGRWGNTQENVFILLALNTYFHVFEGVTPDFTAKMWLGEDYCGEQVFKGRNKDENVLTIPMRQLATTEGSQTLAILKEGPGRLYYRIGMDYAPKNLLLKSLDYGFQIERTYEGVTDPSHVKFDKERNCWRFKAGELVRVIITFTNTSRRYHVALVDFLPAGLEPINPELKGNAPASEEKRSRCWWNWPWYEHVNSRDERVEAFCSLLREGTHTFKHLCRATQIGSFIIPPTKAEEMYSPEIFGRSNTFFAEVYE